jgi:hypothetical protein
MSDNSNTPQSPADEIDIYYSSTNPGVMTPGKNGLVFDFYSCRTQACISAYGTGWEAAPPTDLNIQEGSIVRQVPDGDASLALSLSAFGAFAVAYRYRRREDLRESV